MPWKVYKANDKWCVYRLKEDGEPETDAVACHDTEDMAAAQVRALYASEAEKALEMIGELKVGARNNTQDLQRIQAIHDAAYFLGASCEAEKEEVLESETDAENKGDDISDTQPDRSMKFESGVADDFVVAFGDAVKMTSDGRVSGYLVRFSDAQSPDLTGDYFTHETDFGIDQNTRTPVYYHHGMNKTLGKRRIGIGVMRIDDVGVFVEAELNLRDEYERAIAKMAMAGKQGWSSGTAAHLVERVTEGNARRITHWPLGVDASITPTPAEPRNVVLSMKALVTDDDVLSRTGEQPSPNQTGEVVKTVSDVSQIEEVVMSEIDMGAIATAAAEAAVKRVMEELSKEPATIKAGFDVSGKVDPLSGADDKPFKSLGDQLQAVHRAAMPGVGVDQRLYAVKGPSGMNESLPSEGGFLVQPDFAAELWRRTYDIGQIARRVRRIPISPNANGLRMNAIAESSRATGSRWGGVQVYWLLEGGLKTPTKPAFRQVELSLKKVAGVCYATDELLQDAVALQSVINQAFPEEMNFAVEDAIINGTGAGQPLGIMNAPCLVTVAKESGQVADTLVPDNIKKIWSRMYAPSRSNAVWLINQDVEPQLWSMVESIGTGGVPVYLPPGGLSQQPYSTLFGRPVIPVEYCQTVGDLGDIVLADFSQYVLIDKGGIDAASSIHVRFLYDEQTFRFVYRVDGQPLWEAALTPKNGSNTTGPFVTLAARA